MLARQSRHLTYNCFYSFKLSPAIRSVAFKMPDTTKADPSPVLTLPSGRSHPLFLYGTAWKADKTTPLVQAALSHGFTGIDTACQPKHYQEHLVGQGLFNYLQENSIVDRSSLYIQTKYTPPNGQDPSNTPYDATAPLSAQVKQSVETSLKNLNVDYIDSVLLHSPLQTLEDTIKAWKSLEQFVPHKVRHLGISNCGFPILSALYSSPAINVRPSIVQNRFHEATGYDTQVLAFCKEHGLVYQSFWTLTANPGLLRSKLVNGFAEVRGWTKEQALYALVLSLGREWENGGGVSIMNGTTNEETMKSDLKVLEGMGGVPDGIVEEFVKLLRAQ
ncbi:uncharacterized protein H6S33_011916 [Morchella sextelata]|jgi:diketogulonate reductase-like aldo/keto reductase|uniref:uncharacterized protein n=1 Tax=Morchella sextelata TaxID=1174677 RepID=UPI001D03E2EE|nr:uncharacterized protein H6S33_011916 [Morchella sextelata]KAH0610389.1 hypothetical protein H6S33_011916 [Morchella sextelata]